MKNVVGKTINIIKENRSLNVLVLGFIVYLFVISLVDGEYGITLLALATGGLYIAGALLGKIRKYIPVVMSVIAILVFLAAGILTIAGKPISIGFVAFGVVVIFYSITAYDSTNGMKCLPYCFAMFGAECVFCLNGDTRGAMVLVGALLLSVMFTNATYTAMAKYVFALFLAIVIIKCTGIWHIINGTQASGLIGAFIDSWVLYVAMVVLGIASLLLMERHPRFKSDRDKKYVPVLKQWQTVIGFSMIMLVFWGMIYMDGIFQMEETTTGITNDMIWNLVYVNTVYLLDDSVMMSVFRSYGFVPLMLFTMMLISFIYKAYANYSKSKLFADKIILLMMAGFFVYAAFLGVCVPVLLLFALLAGCVVNGSYAIEEAE